MVGCWRGMSSPRYYILIIRLAEIANNVAQVSSNIASTQVILNIILDSQRNRLIIYELKATLATAGISAGAFVASMFGMNLTSGLEEAPDVFWCIAGGSAFLAGAIFWGALRRMQQLGSMSKTTQWRSRFDVEGAMGKDVVFGKKGPSY